uniref:Uncharacterized protein n=1 Tax=Amphimedon queenslandica TaxID=400682 RepID=A0A1X7UXV4_AMPQE
MALPISMVGLQQSGEWSIVSPCVLFATRGYHNSDPGVLVSKPLTNFKFWIFYVTMYVKNIIYIQLLVKTIS